LGQRRALSKDLGAILCEQLRKAVYVFILKRLRKSRAWGAVHKPGHATNP
jgi:hypothetical protein